MLVIALILGAMSALRIAIRLEDTETAKMIGESTELSLKFQGVRVEPGGTTKGRRGH